MKKRESKFELFFLFLVLLIASFLRLYRLKDFQFFSYDQARDYLIVKRILVDHKLTLIGPSLALADGAYLPPLYYYFLAPFLLLSNFHLWGPDFLSALIGLGGIFVFYLLAEKMFGRKPAFYGSLFYVFNPYLIQTARHCRNPHWLPLTVLLFAFFLRKYLKTHDRKDLWLCSLFFGISLSLHITTIVFLPIFLYLIGVEIKKKNLTNVAVSLAIVVFFFSPLIIFDFRHNFRIGNALLVFFKNQGYFLEKFKRFFVFIPMIPIILFSGNFQKELLSLRSLPIMTLEKINFAGLSSVEFLKHWAGVFLLFLTSFFFFWGLKEKNNKEKFGYVFIFVFSGFFISFLPSLNYSYFYYFYPLFPFLLLLLTGAISVCLKILEKRFYLWLNLILIILALFSFVPAGLKTETRPENFFLPVAEVIAQDYSPFKKVAIAANINDINRWEKNGLEYRYFLEAFYRLPLGNWDVEDYKTADVLYLIDEGNLPEPLKLGGMEMETFRPVKIEKAWEVKTGQKIYKMTRIQ